jgi:hypothetical protein
VYVIKNRLPKNDETGSDIRCDITEYLKRIAGFVKYSITIKENQVETLITNPNTSKPVTATEFQIEYKFPINNAFLPQSVEIVKEYFIEQQFHLKSDLNLTNYDGCITYMIPKSEYIDIINDGHSWPTSQVRLVDFNHELTEKKQVKWNNEWIDFHRHPSRADRHAIPERSYIVLH